MYYTETSDPLNKVAEVNDNNNLDGPKEVVVTGCNPPSPTPTATATHTPIPGRDSYEPDGSCSQARPVAADGVHYRHTLWPVGDQDWIRIDMVAGLEYVISTEDVGEDGDTKVELWDYCQGSVLGSDQDALGPGAQLTWQATATGPYYVQIAHTQPTHGPDTHFDLWVQTTGAVDAYEPDDTCQTARETVANGPAQDHLFGMPGDEDWLRFQAVAGMVYHVSLDNLGPAAQPRLGLYGRCGEAIGAERGAGQPLEWTPSQSSLYALRVRNANPLAYGPTTHYRLSITASGGEPDPGEPDGSPSGARMIATNGVAQVSNIAPPSDQDWFYFDTTAGQTYHIETFNLGPVADTVACLYAAGGTTWLTCDDDSGAGLASRIWWRAPATNRYYLKVRDYNQDAGGSRVSYQLAVTAGAPACDPDLQEDDNTYYQAKDLGTNGAWQHHNTCPEGDADWVRFWTPAGRTFAIETANLGPDTDTLLTLYDTDGQTPLWSNDDAGPGRESRILWTFRREGVYYVKAEPFGRTGAGRGTEFDLRVVASSVTPTPTNMPTPTFTPTSSPTPSPSPTPTSPPSAHTIIVTNGERIRTLYGQAAQTGWLAALTRLAGHDRVRGVVLDATTDPAAAAAYTAWAADLTNVNKANYVADAVRNLVMRQLARSPDVVYIVIAGDDRVVPYRRVADRPEKTKAYESAYPDVSKTSTVGAALAADTSLNDDFYADREPLMWEGESVYLPDVAIARLVETPAEVAGVIDAFIANPDLAVTRAFVAGYALQEDGADQTCQDLKDAGLPGSAINCDLIGGSWGAAPFQALQLRAAPRFDLQGLFVRSWHYIEGSPIGSCSQNPGACTYAQNIVDAPADLRGALIWQTGGYGGLNVPPGNPASELDLPQAFARKGANYAGNTGTALVGEDGVALAERLMNTFARELVAVPQITAGEAWMRAKRSYYGQTQNFSEYDRKVLSVATLYGLPMTMVRTGPGTFGNPFPSVTITVTGGGTFGEAITRTLELDLNNTLGDNSDYYDLDGHAAISPDTPAQPQYYATPPAVESGAMRSAIWTGGVYSDLPDYQPLRAKVAVLGPEEPVGQAVAVVGEEPPRGWSPAFPALVNAETGELLTLSLGQYNEDSGTERIYSGLTFDLYFGDSPDQTPPALTWTIARAIEGKAFFKVEAGDPSGVQRVTVTYTQDDLTWRSLDLRYDDTIQKWVGVLPEHGNLTWLAQAVDGAGNKALDSNKGRYYHIALPHGLYLPLVIR